MALTELDAEQLGRRIKAARLLRNIDQAQLAEGFVADGLDRHELGKLERGKFPLTRVRLDTLCRHLQVPERWFTSANTDLVVGLTSEAELSADQRELVVRAARLLAEAGQGNAQAAPPLREVSDGPGQSGEPGQ